MKPLSIAATTVLAATTTDIHTYGKNHGKLPIWNTVNCTLTALLNLPICPILVEEIDDLVTDD